MDSSVPGIGRWPGVVAVPLVVAALLGGLLSPVGVAGTAQRRYPPGLRKS